MSVLKVVVIGGTGLIGSKLVKQLRETLIDREKFVRNGAGAAAHSK